MKIEKIHIYGDSQLIIKQIIGDFKINKPELISYHEYALKLLRQIPEVTLTRITRSENGKADALAKLAKELANPHKDPILITIQNRHALTPAIIQDDEGKEMQESLVISNENDWRDPFHQIFQRREITRK
ncbi:hypothetical protein MA16_Dca028525 [Dendrobium catenatum]|uniref:RNase H type-1 domain-containing protein n=1 Tax=Dendrobium catenatum TaxID=906689 RepID=A0A2I0VGJ5_9ASPA|nr:hypothetical protein MA16_Dca028525 [Dendrobium catenatum]